MIEKLFNFVVSAIDSPKDFLIGYLLGAISVIGLLIFLVE